MSFLGHRNYICRFIIPIFTLFCSNYCESLSGSEQFNESLREFSISTDLPIQNATKIQSLHKQNNHHNYLNDKYSPRASNLVRFKDTPDNSLSSSTYSRGFAPHDFSGYSFDVAPYEGGGYEHFHHIENHEPHFLDHGFRHKVHDHQALAVKTFLWPLAGIALLGAAAALVTNPILLQLGVVSGRRKRSTTPEHSTKPTLEVLESNKFETATETKAHSKYESYPIADRRNFNSQPFQNRNKINYIIRKHVMEGIPNAGKANYPKSLVKNNDNSKWDNGGLIPIPLKFKRDKNL